MKGKLRLSRLTLNSEFSQEHPVVRSEPPSMGKKVYFEAQKTSAELQNAKKLSGLNIGTFKQLGHIYELSTLQLRFINIVKIHRLKI